MTKALDRLIAAAESYGDAARQQHRELYGWKVGDPRPTTMDLSIAQELHGAAKAFAGSTRARRAKATGASS